MSVDIDLGPVSDLSPSTVVPPGYPVLVRLGPGWRKSSTPSAASSLSSQSPHPASATLSSCPSHQSLPPISAHPTRRLPVSSLRVPVLLPSRQVSSVCSYQVPVTKFQFSIVSLSSCSSSRTTCSIPVSSRCNRSIFSVQAYEFRSLARGLEGSPIKKNRCRGLEGSP